MTRNVQRLLRFARIQVLPAVENWPGTEQPSRRITFSCPLRLDFHPQPQLRRRTANPNTLRTRWHSPPLSRTQEVPRTEPAPPVRKDRSDRLWNRAKKEVMRWLPGVSQSTLARRLALFEKLLEAFVEGEIRTISEWDFATPAYSKAERDTPVSSQELSGEPTGRLQSFPASQQYQFLSLTNQRPIDT